MAVTSTHDTIDSIPEEVFLSCIFPYLTCQEIVTIGKTCKWGRALLEDGFTQRLFCLRHAMPEGFWFGTWKKTRVQWLRLILGKEPLEQAKTTAKTDRVAVGQLWEGKEVRVCYKGFDGNHHQFHIAELKKDKSPYTVSTDSFCDVAVMGTDVVIYEGWLPGGYRATHVNYWEKSLCTIQTKHQFLALDPTRGALSLWHGSEDSSYLTLVLGVNISSKYPKYKLEPIEENELHISGVFIFSNYFISFATRRRLMGDCNDKLVIWRLEEEQGIRMGSHSLGQQFSRPVRLGLQDNILEIYAAGRFVCEVKLWTNFASDTDSLAISPDSSYFSFSSPDDQTPLGETQNTGSETHSTTTTIEIE